MSPQTSDGYQRAVQNTTRVALNLALASVVWLATSCVFGAPTSTPSSKPKTIAGYKVPHGDIYVARFVWRGERMELSAPTNITKRPFGYDNQPHFSRDGKSLFYTSMRDGVQADIYRYELATGRTTQVTRTPESEFSPTITPDGRHFSSVLIEKDKTQRLWQFRLSDGRASLVLPGVKDVGYHCWLSATKLLLFIVGKKDDHRLVIADRASGTTRKIADHPGRSLHLAPTGKTAYYVDQRQKSGWWIMALDLATLQATRLVQTLPKSEDFAVLADGSLLMARGAVLYRFRPAKDKAFRPVADLKGWGIKEIGRLAIDRRQRTLALVAK